MFPRVFKQLDGDTLDIDCMMCSHHRLYILPGGNLQMHCLLTTDSTYSRRGTFRWIVYSPQTLHTPQGEPSDGCLLTTDSTYSPGGTFRCIAYSPQTLHTPQGEPSDALSTHHRLYILPKGNLQLHFPQYNTTPCHGPQCYMCCILCLCM